MSWIQWLESRKLYTADPGEPVRHAAARMAEHRVGALAVVEGGRLVGMLSERDVLCRVVAEGRDPERTRVGEVSTPDPKVVTESSSLAECAELIKRYGFRHVPVIDENGAPVGMLSSRSFLRFALDELERLVVEGYREQRREELTDPYSLIA